MIRNKLIPLVRDSLTLINRKKDGQSLVEVLLALVIGGLRVATAGFGIAYVLRSSKINQNYQSATALGKGLMSRIVSYESADWGNLYNLSKGSASNYFLNATSAGLFAVTGTEAVLDNDVPNGLMGYWKFDEATSTNTSTTYDYSGNGHDGTIN